MITCKQQFDWIIKMECDLIGPKIDYLNTNTFKEYKKNVSNKRKSHHYHNKFPTLHAVYTHADLITSSFSCIFN